MFPRKGKEGDRKEGAWGRADSGTAEAGTQITSRALLAMGALAPPFAGVGASASCAISCSRLYEEEACVLSFSAAITGGRLFMCGNGCTGVMGD